MKKYSIFLYIFTILAIFNLPGVESSGHISLSEGDVKIVKTDGEMLKAIVNYPLATGDVILTGNKGRCELQLTNGTLLRLDKNSDIKLISLLTESITSSKKISTLKLMNGTIYSMSQIYKNEILQVITPQISVKMENRSTNLIRTTQKESSVRVIRGKVGVIYGEQKKTYLKSGQYVIFPRKGKKYDGKLSDNDEFLTWNKSINKNFKELHYGNSKVPEQIYIHSPGIIHFAERFSTKFGTWEYNEYFGYVWKPGVDVFHGRRPFFDANYVEIDGELVLVPNQAWGWAPVHLGTWFFSKTDGWLWIPGERKFEKLNLPASGFDGYFWNPEIDYYYMNFASVGLLPEFHFSTNFPKHSESSEITGPPAKTNPEKSISKNTKGISTIINSKRSTISRNMTKLNSEKIKRDWNPDSRLVRRAGIKLEYDSRGNRISLPDLKITSKNIKGWQKLTLKKAIFNSKGNIVSISKFTSSGASIMNNNTSTSSSGSSSSSGHVGGGMSGNGSSGGSGNGGGEKN